MEGAEVPFSWQAIPELPQVDYFQYKHYINADVQVIILFIYRNQAEQTPELEDKFIPTLLEPTDLTPWRRTQSPQVHD